MLRINEVNVVDDDTDEMDVIRDIIETEKPEDAFYVADIGDIIRRHHEWLSKMPKVVPHYAIKCNSDPTVIKVLAALNASFDCASKQEIRQVMKCGVQSERIIFAHPTKLPSHIKYSKKVGVERMTVDSETELSKIHEYFPEAKIVIRIRCDAANSPVSLGTKFGCEPRDEAVRLIRHAKDLGLNLHGFSFHVGSPCRELDAYRRGIKMCSRLIDVARAAGCENARLIDIGGGFTGDRQEIDELAEVVNDAVEDLQPDVSVISEPGRYYVDSSFTLASYLHSKKIVCRDGEPRRMYYMNCGVFNSFLDEMLGLRRRRPQLLFEPTKAKEKFPSFVWGPTADSYDLIVKDMSLPELYVGDWLVWKNMGAYTLSLSNTFNGFPIPSVIPFIRKNQWVSFLKQIGRQRKDALHSRDTTC